MATVVHIHEVGEVELADIANTYSDDPESPFHHCRQTEALAGEAADGRLFHCHTIDTVDAQEWVGVWQDRELYLVLCQTMQGKRYWQTAADPDTVNPAERAVVIGPATIGPSGHTSKEEALNALSLNPGLSQSDLSWEWFSLDDPNSWPISEPEVDSP